MECTDEEMVRDHLKFEAQNRADRQAWHRKLLAAGMVELRGPAVHLTQRYRNIARKVQDGAQSD